MCTSSLEATCFEDMQESLHTSSLTKRCCHTSLSSHIRLLMHIRSAFACILCRVAMLLSKSLHLCVTSLLANSRVRHCKAFEDFNNQNFPYKLYCLTWSYLSATHHSYEPMVKTRSRDDIGVIQDVHQRAYKEC